MRPQAGSRDAVHSAQGVNSPVGFQRFDDVSVVFGLEGAPGDSGYRDRATYVVVTDCNNKPILSRCDTHATGLKGIR